MMRSLSSTLVLLVLLGSANAAEPKLSPTTTRERQPQRFAIIFNQGYAGDHLPKDHAEFEQLLMTIKEAHFNVLLCSYDAKRAALCKKYDLQMFVDLLADDYHVYKKPDACKQMLMRLHNDPTIYGYHLWSDNIGNTAGGRSRDVKNVQEWDPTHPAYVGSYRMSKISSVEGMDLFGYYDFHWTRGGHWEHLNTAFTVSQARQIGFLRYDAANPGVIGKGNPNRAGYTIATSIPFGLKGYTYHAIDGIVDAKFQLGALGQDVQKVNATFASIAEELARLPLPNAVYSTTVSVDERDKKLDRPEIPRGLPAIPKDSTFQITTGEVLIGVNRTDKHTVLRLANHNPYHVQTVKLQLTNCKSAELFDRQAKSWKPLRINEQKIRFSVGEYAVELLRLEQN